MIELHGSSPFTGCMKAKLRGAVADASRAGSLRDGTLRIERACGVIIFRCESGLTG
jgi:hypothetical protein